MKIAFNPSTVAALTTPPNNKDITFDLRGRNIFAQGVKFYGTDTNTWRDIKINNVSIGSHTLELFNGINTILYYNNGVLTINSTWRPVVDNLTSDSTTSSLSANQGRVLKALIDGKSNSDHNHDDRYVKKSGDTMYGVLTIDTSNFEALIIKRNDDVSVASIQFRGKSSVYGFIGLNNSTKDKQFLRWSSDSSRVYTILDTSSTYVSNGKGVINGTTITQVDNATNARKLVNWYSARPTSLNTQFGDGSLRIFYATSSTTVGKPAEDSHILHLAWDNIGGYDAQLAVHTSSGKVSTRAQDGGTWQPWKTLAFLDSKVADSYKLDGIPRNHGQAPFGTIPYIGNDGVMEIGRYIDFHYDNSGGYNYSTRIEAPGNYENTVSLPSESGTLALTTYGGNASNPIFLGCLNLSDGGDGTVSSSFSCRGHSVSFTYTRGIGNYCKIVIPDTKHLIFYITAAIASVNYSGRGMDTWTGNHRGSGAWWLHCYAYGYNEVRVKGFHLGNEHNDSWWGGNPLWHYNDGANKITVCIFGYVVFK